MRQRCQKPVTGIILAGFTLWSAQSQAASSTWNVDANGNWSLAGNWLGSVIPNGVGEIASFNFNYTNNRTITLDTPVTLGGIHIGDSLGANLLTFAGGSALTLDATAGNTFINKYNSTTDTWQAPLVLNDHLNANIFAGLLDVNGAANAQVAITSTASDLIKNGTGTLRLNLDATNFAGRVVTNYGTLNIGGANSATPAALGSNTGADGILLRGAGIAGQTILSLNNNGGASNSTITYTGNNDVTVAGATTLNVDRNYIGGANSGNTIVLDQLNFGGGILGVTGGNGYALRFNGAITLTGQTNVFSPSSATLTLGGVIDDGANTRALIKEGGARLVLDNAANTYGGVTVVKEGFLQLTANAVTGTGRTYVNGGVLSLLNTQQAGGATLQGGLELVSQIGTSRAILPVIGNLGYAIDSGNILSVNVPIYGMAVGVDGNISSTIDLSFVGSGGSDSNRVSVMNVGGDRTYTGTILPSQDSMIRVHTNTGTFIISGANSLGGATPSGATGLIVGLAYANPLLFSGGPAITLGTGGTVSVRNNNVLTGPVTVNRGVTLNVNGAGLTTPIGTGVVTLLGGTLATDGTNDVKLGNTDFRLYGGSTMLLDNNAVTVANTDRRLLATSDIDLTSSTLRMIGDGSVAITSAQTVNSIDYQGGNTISVDTDIATAATRLAVLTTGTLNRVGRGTLNLRNT
ncbi:MAG: hypothetical protein JNG86_08805, partial [Verrucomicrobiaceae bacterium]|nr:hypothetical protein [Verrucomicrobiaceae bacterium]